METLHQKTIDCRFLVLALGIIGLSAATKVVAAEPFTVEVVAGHFEVFVEGSATLDARQSVTLSSELPSNSGKIVWLADEGSYVEAGAVVARFDRAPFEEQIVEHRRDLDDARAALVQAEAEQQIQIQRTRESREKAELAHRSAEIRLKNLRRAEHPLRLATAKSAVHTARVALSAALTERQSQQEMLNEGFGTQIQLDEAIALEQDRRNLSNLAKREHELLETVVLPGELEQAQLDLQNKAAEKKHLTAANAHVLAKQNAVLVRLNNRVQELEQTLRKSERLLQQTSLEAPVSGFVVYREISVQNERRKAQVGDSVWHRHGFIVIPDMAAMVAHLNVRESEVGKLAPGQVVELIPEAHPDLVLNGVVSSVGTLAAERSSTDNLFKVRIDISDVDGRLRPGMRAHAAVLTVRHTDVLRVPVEAVYYDDETVVYTWRAGRTHRKVVELGDSDGQFVVVTTGLEVGERVLLTPPPQLSAGR